MFEDCLSIVVGYSQLIHVCHTLLVQSSLYYLIVAATVERTFGETVSQPLPCIIGHFQVHNSYSRFQRCSLFRLY